MPVDHSIDGLNDIDSIALLRALSLLDSFSFFLSLFFFVLFFVLFFLMSIFFVFL
jgi:hypothetical protein